MIARGTAAGAPGISLPTPVSPLDSGLAAISSAGFEIGLRLEMTRAISRGYGGRVALWYHLCYRLSMLEVREYLDEGGQSPFARWFDRLNAAAAAKVATALVRMEQGNLSNVQGVGAGVFEYRIDFGPGYRIYFGKHGEKLVILLGGGTKKRQQKDIEIAKRLWDDYKRRR